MDRRTFVILCFEGAVLSFNVAATAAIVPSVAQDFGLSQFIAGKIVWLYMLPYGISALLYGPLVRLIDAKKVELFCLSLFSLANLLAALSGNIHTLFAARFFMGVFGASVIPLGLILIGRHIENKNRGRFVGGFFSATFVASLAGLFLSGIVHWRMIYLIPAILGFVLVFFIHYYLPSFKQDAGSLKINYLSAFKNRQVQAVFTYIFFISLFYHGIQQWLGVYFSQRFHFSQFMVSMLITLTSLSGIFGEAVGGRLADVIGRIKTIDLGIILMVISVFSLILKSPLAVLALVMIIWGVGWTFNHAGLSTMLTDLPKEFLNESASLNSSIRFISGGIGAVFGGIIMQRSFNAGFTAIGLLLVLLAVFAKKLLVVR